MGHDVYGKEIDMTAADELTAVLIDRAERHEGVVAGACAVADVLAGPSHRAEPEALDDSLPTRGSLLVLGLHHPESDPELDWWQRGNTNGNRRLSAAGNRLSDWLADTYGVAARDLPYPVEKGGVFLKDAAVLAGLGVIGQSNLLIHPQYGANIRLRAVWVDRELEPTGPLTDFDPCQDCPQPCLAACPRHALENARYSRPDCQVEMAANQDAQEIIRQDPENDRPVWAIKYCRACETGCAYRPA
jgi:epoxyqueuosine reductase